MENDILKPGTEVTINLPFTYVIGYEGFKTGNILNTIFDCKNEVMAELELEDEVIMNVQLNNNVHIPEFIQNIDWKMLREQKAVINTFAQTKLYGYLRDHVDGITHLIDSIQDYAVDVCGLDETEVFGELRDK